MVSAGMTFVKYLLFLFNFVFWVSGIGVLVAGAVIKIRFSNYVNFLGDTFLATPIILIIAGCVIAVIGFFGCCGAIRENYCMTMTFAVLLGVVFILEIGAGIAAYVLKTDVNRVVSQQAIRGIKHYGDDGYDGLKNGWNKLQSDMTCCGVVEYSDWNVSPAMQNSSVPDSCCKKYSANCGQKMLLTTTADAERTSIIYTKGCLGKLKAWVTENAAIVGGVAVGIAFIQIFGIILSCCFGSNLRKGYEGM